MGNGCTDRSNSVSSERLELEEWKTGWRIIEMQKNERLMVKVIEQESVQVGG